MRQRSFPISKYPRSDSHGRTSAIRRSHRGVIARTASGTRHQEKSHRPFMPPEDWHEPSEDAADCYRIVEKDPGEGFQHVVTPQEIADRLAQLPDYMLTDLAVVQLSRMTRKKRTFPCYGMQWGPTLYLYPIEVDLVETFTRPPRPAERIETEMYGGRWEQIGGGHWQLHWTETTVKDFFLNNVLIHELGHLLDNRNTGYVDRERYAEAFAVKYGYLQSETYRRKVAGSQGSQSSEGNRGHRANQGNRRHHKNNRIA